jgi:hypothetical protein
MVGPPSKRREGLGDQRGRFPRKSARTVRPRKGSSGVTHGEYWHGQPRCCRYREVKAPATDEKGIEWFNLATTGANRSDGGDRHSHRRGIDAMDPPQFNDHFLPDLEDLVDRLPETYLSSWVYSAQQFQTNRLISVDLV